MPQSFQEWLVVFQLTMQRIALTIVTALALASAAWAALAMLGLAPWLQLQVGFGETKSMDAGVAVQTLLTLLLLGLCFFLPTNARVMRLERSHREFTVSMSDVAQAYHAAHADDRAGAFKLRSEYDSVRERLVYLRSHPHLGHLEPEILELAAQMSHQSRELAEVYSDAAVERARGFLQQRQEEAHQFQERVQAAYATCREMKRWLEKVEVEEAVARSQLQRLEDDLREIFPALGFDLIHKGPAERVDLPTRIAAE